jgi:hypothetical protein
MHGEAMIQTLDRQAIYGTIREEILDQKRCQFQLFSLSVTATALILAYAASTKAIPLVYLAPMVMNVFVLWMILDKAGSIQRKVGYLQMMEGYSDQYVWMWETQLDKFRGSELHNPPRPGDPPKKHRYVTAVGWMLTGLNVLSAVICSWGVWAVDRSLWGSDYERVSILVAAAALLISSLVILRVKRRGLVTGRQSGPAIRKAWEDVLAAYRVSV